MNKANRSVGSDEQPTRNCVGKRITAYEQNQVFNFLARQTRHMADIPFKFSKKATLLPSPKLNIDKDSVPKRTLSDFASRDT